MMKTDYGLDNMKLTRYTYMEYMDLMLYLVALNQTTGNRQVASLTGFPGLNLKNLNCLR